jgi:phage-related protein
MATEKKFKATIEIGGAVAGSLKSSFAAVTGNTKILGSALSKLTSQQKKLESFNSAQLRIGETQKKLMQAMKAGDTSGVERLRKSLDTQRQSLTKLGEELKKAKINTKDLSGEMERLGRKADATKKVIDSWGKIKPIGDNFQTVLKRTAGGFVAIGAAAAAASAGVWKLGSAFGDFSDSAAEAADTLGVDTNFLLSVKYAAADVGVAVEMVDKMISEMNIRMVDAGEEGNKTGEALRELGLDIGKLQKLDTAAQFATISEAFKNYSGNVNKAKLATDAFGKAGRKAPNLLNLGKDGLNDYAKAAQEAGYLLSEADERMGDEFGKQFLNLNKSLEGARNIIGREILPVITDLLVSLGSFIRENAPNIKAMAQEFGGWLKTNGPIIGTQIRDMAKSLVEMGKAAWPFIESVGGVKAVLTGIATIAFLPTIAAVASLGASFITAVPAVIKLTTGLWGMAAGATGIIPVIGGAATALWGMAVAGWAAIAPLLPAIAIGAAIIGGLTLLAFGIKHVVEKWDQYSAKISEVWKLTTDFVGGMGSAIGGWVTSTMASISGLGTSIYDSIAGAFDRLTGKISQWFGWVREKFANLGSSIKGVFTGGDSPAPIDGARASGGPVSSGKNYLVGERGPEIFSPSASGSIIPNHRAGGSVSNDNRTITINITASPGMNERTLADLVLARLDGRQAALAGGALYD